MLYLLNVSKKLTARMPVINLSLSLMTYLKQLRLLFIVEFRHTFSYQAREVYTLFCTLLKGK